MNFETFTELVDWFKNKIVNKENFIKDMKAYFNDYSEVLEMENTITFIFDDFDIKVIFKSLTDKESIKILNILHC